MNLAQFPNMARFLTPRFLSPASFSRRWISASSGGGVGSSGGADQTVVKGKRFAAVWGNGDYGRLGLGSFNSQFQPHCLSASSFGNQNVASISCGGAHTLFLTENGNVYATGLNDFGQLGISDDKSYTTEPLEVFGLTKQITKIAAGYHHSSAITVDGELYVWGKNANGQLGLGKKAPAAVPIPSKVESLRGVTIKNTSLAFEHSIAVTDNGEVLTWGSGASGRLGHGYAPGVWGFLKNNSEYRPRLIKALEEVKIKDVAAGMMHSACIDDNGSVYVFGERAVDKLGFSQAKNTTELSMMSELPQSTQVACGGYHTCVLTSGGELYTWGSNENGCLGVGGIDIAYSPERVEGPFLRHSVYKVSCGWKHTAAISEGNIYMWGWGGSHGTFAVDGRSSAGQLGQGSDFDFFEPAMVNFHKSVKALYISCGFNHTGAILEYA